ncbi:Uncharacterised protein [Acinetobacter baumannii]|nr:Uncharacterised protein [Acinetobacter baumannii]
MIMKMISFAKLSHRHLSGVSFEIKTTMKDKFGANTTPKGSGASEAQKDYLKNIRDHSKESTESMRFGRNDFNLNKEQFDYIK